MVKENARKEDNRKERKKEWKKVGYE